MKLIFLLMVLGMQPSFSVIRTKLTNLPEGFVHLNEVDASIIQEMRYFDDHNFIGKKIPGYQAPSCILTTASAYQLSQVQMELKKFSMSLKVYDCYRPQRAVDSFIAWAKDIQDVKMKKEFYPNLDKANLFKDGYIAEQSGHSRGSTVDLTIVPLPIPQQAQYHDGDVLSECFLPVDKRFQDNSLDFGTGFDCFDPRSHTEHSEVGFSQKINRLLLKTMMEKHGFKNLAEEWWHYTLRQETFPNRYFDFEVQ